MALGGIVIIGLLVLVAWELGKFTLLDWIREQHKNWHE